MSFAQNMLDALKQASRKVFPAKSPLEQHVAVFGERGSGKTMLLSTFYGWQQEPTVFEHNGYGLLATNTEQGQRLTSNYLKIEDSKTPPQTKYDFESFEFAIKVRGMENRPGKLVWHDYPGEWFEESKGGKEGQRKIEAFKKLLTSDVALILFDGQKLKDQGELYLKKVIRGYREELERRKHDLMPDGKRLNPFPRIWVLCLSKSDLFPNEDVHAFRNKIIKYADDELKELRKVIESIVEGKDYMSIGEDYLLLSSAQFDPGTGQIQDPKKHTGIELIMPLAIAMPIKRALWWSKVYSSGTKTIGNIADALKSLTTNWMQYIPIVGKVFKGLDDAADVVVKKLKEIEESSRRKGNAAEAATAAMASKLYEDKIKRVYYTTADTDI